MTCDERRDLLLLYVADALDASEADELREHLQSGCPACAGHLAEAQALMASLPLGLDRVAPPPGLKERVMARLPAVDAGPKLDQDELSDSAPMRIFRWLVPMAVAAGLAIVATHFVMNQKLDKLQREANSLRMDRNGLSMIVASQQQQLELLSVSSQSQVKMVNMLRSPDVRIIRLQPTDQQPNAVANLLWDQKQQQWAILTDGMKPAAAGETYELWFIPKSGAPVEAGTFDVDATGRGSLHVSVPKDIGPLATAAVTDEKAGGVAAPAGHFQVKADLN